MTDPAIYAPRPGSVAYNVCRFLVENPDEELTREDISLKFDVAAASVDSFMQLPTAKGVLRKIRKPDTGIVWIRGTEPVHLPDVPAGAAVEVKPLASTPQDPAPFLTPVRPEDGLPVIRNHPLLTEEQERLLMWTVWLGEFRPRNSAEFAEALLADIRKAAKQYSKEHGVRFRIASLGRLRWGIERTK